MGKKQDSKFIVHSAHGVDIYMEFIPAKKAGSKDHLWIQVRQPMNKEGKKFQVYTALAYRNSVDLHLIK